MKPTSASPPLFPIPHRADDAARQLAEWADAPGALAPLLLAAFGNSPYLSRLLALYPDVAHGLAEHGADATETTILREMRQTAADTDRTGLMRALRVAKGKIALLTALADMGGKWPLERVTAALSDLAEHTLELALDHILRAAVKVGEITFAQESGIIVLGMGKLGGRELNYSSDIDLIVLYEPGRLHYKGRHTEQHFMNRLAHELVALMQDRTEGGYVFRTDLRLRPDPASTPPAITTEAALYYYESVGQNWERAAMIKARPVAGDIPAAERFLKSIGPFMWRRNLDFAAINDIHSIKRQMDSHQGKKPHVRGHNIKLGMGGIREIEFFAQIHQLIWGGREPKLRTRATCETLAALVDMGLVPPEQERLLVEAYRYFRQVEHRLQMVADEQTHSLPADEEGMAHIAHFMGYASAAEFERELFFYLDAVHAIYANSFKGGEALGEEGNLVFTGVSHDPDTLATIKEMGYCTPETISEIIMSWHHGSKRATRTKRARELLTEMTPLLLKRLSETAHPDSAFMKFNEFLTNLPSGVQIFSLFHMNPHLLPLVAMIMGSAPMLAEALSKTPSLLDATLYDDFYAALPSPQMLQSQCEQIWPAAPDIEARMDALRRFRNEKQFQAGVQMLQGVITAREAGLFLSQLAELMLAKTMQAVVADFTAAYGTIEGSRFSVIGLGKLGSREMTFSSDIDLVFVYDVPDFERVSSGEKSFSASVYYNRLAQRFIGALSGMGRDGKLYDVDTRLRPSGKQGLLAVSTKALSHYFSELAWTFEYMAFTKARAVVGPENFCDELDDFIRAQLTKPRDENKLRADVVDMRARIAAEFGDANPWDIKYARGGLMDIDFMAQYLALLHAPKTPGARTGSAAELFDWLARTGRMAAADAEQLIEADRFLGQIFNMLRLTAGGALHETGAPEGLKRLLAASVKAADFNALKARVIEVEAWVRKQYSSILSESA